MSVQNLADCTYDLLHITALETHNQTIVEPDAALTNLHRFIAMFAWVFRFGLFGAGNPGAGVWMFVLSCIVYGVAFDFFNISGSLYVNMKTDEKIRSSAQGLFMLMTNGIGATIGTLGAQVIVNKFVNNAAEPSWSTAWYIFAAYALVVGILFAILFKDPKKQGIEA